MNQPPNNFRTATLTAVATIAVAVLGAGAVYYGVKPIDNTETIIPSLSNQIATPSPEMIDLKIKGNKASKIYHPRGCPNYNDIAERNIIWFKTSDEAKSAGYRMARNC